MIVKDCFFALSNFSIVVLYGPLWKLLSTFFSFNKFYGSYKILGCWESDGTFLHRKVCHDFPDSLIILICVIHPRVHNHHQVEEVKFKVVKVRPCPIWSVGRYLGLNELMSMGPWSDHVSVIKDTSESLIFFLCLLPCEDTVKVASCKPGEVSYSGPNCLVLWSWTSQLPEYWWHKFLSFYATWWVLFSYDCLRERYAIGVQNWSW